MAPHLSPYVKNGNTIYVSGQLAFNDQGVIEGNITSQTKVVLARIEALLKENGLGLTDVGKCSIWIVNENDFPACDKAYAEMFGDHKPARATVVSGLTAPGALVEIDAIAWKQ